jgi:hypothetical protein
MKQILAFFICVFIAASCKLPNEDKKYTDPESITYHLKFNPDSSSKYHYDIKNTTETEIELENKKIQSINTTTTGMSYVINKDTSGNYIVNITYDKVHLYTKTNDSETEADAENASFPLNPADKMLGALKDANLTVSISPTGDIKILSGYKELSEQLMSSLDANDVNARSVAQKQLDKLIGEGMIQKNLDQLFKMFPDSAVHVGDKWKIDSRQNGDFNLNIKTFYRLKDIHNGVAYINSESDLESDNTPIAMLGASVIPNLKGTQEGKYEMEAKTGMLLNGAITSEVKGNMQMMGREVPVKIKTKVNIKGEKSN